jgi:TRAP-type mannitol/chloroaromatic compound transport system substrate-binding protein
MKRLTKLRLVFCVVIIICIAGFIVIVDRSQLAFAAEPSKVYKWKMQSVDPPVLIGPTITQRAFCDRVKKMSNGRIDISLFTAGQLVPTMEISAGLERRTIDIAYTSAGYYMGSVPEGTLEMVGMPPMFLQTIEDALQVYWYMGVDEIIREAFIEKGVYFLGSVFLGDPVTHWSKRPMRSVTDLKGWKTRSYGYLTKILAKFGSMGTLIPHEEVYTAMATGIVEGSYTAGSYYERLKYYEVCPNFYLPGWIPVPSMCIMVSLKAWNELPDDLKAILKEAHAAFTIDHYQRTFWDFQNSLKRLPKMGVNIITWPDKEMEKLREVSFTFFPEIASKSPRCAKAVNIVQDYMRMRGYLK